MAEPVERAGECLVGAVLGLGEPLDRVPPETLLELLGAPDGPLVPGAGGGWVTELTAQIGDERAQRLCRQPPSLVAAQRAEPAVPVVVPRDTGMAAHAFPAGRRQVLAVVIAQREVGEHVEHVPPAQSPPIDVEQIEHEAGRQALGERGAGPSVPRNVGSREMVLDEAGVRALRRPQHGDPLERGARPCGVDDEAGGFAHLFVGIGGRDDRDRAWSTLARFDARIDVGVGGTERIEELAGVGVGGGVSGELCDDSDIDLLAECAHERDRSSGQLLGEVEHEVAQPLGCTGADGVGGRGEQGGFVVPACFEGGRDGGADANRLAASKRFVV